MQATRPHEAPPQPSLLAGPGADKDDAVLAYYRLPELASREVVSVAAADSGAAEEEVVEMFPDAAGYLRGSSWEAEHAALWAEVTDVFAGDTPLFYVHVCRYPAASAGSVRVALADGRSWPQDCAYLVTARPEGEFFRLYVYTSFLRDDDYIVAYTAAMPGPGGKTRLVEGYTEPLYPCLVGLAVSGTVANHAGFTYSISPGAEWGRVKIRVPDGIVKDTRRPTPFRYALRADVTGPDGATRTYLSPWHSEVVYAEDSLLENEREQYSRGRKALTEGSVAQTMRLLLSADPAVAQGSAVVRYSALSDSAFVQVWCRPDGEGPVWAWTTADTGAPPAVLSLAGRKWRYLEYTEENLSRLGLASYARPVRVTARITSGEQVLAERTFDVAAGFGFGEATIYIQPGDFAGIPQGAALAVEAINRLAGVDLQLEVGGRPCAEPTGELAVSWDEVQAAGGARVILREVYRPGCFVRVYAVRLVRSMPLGVDVAPRGGDEAWPLLVGHGRLIRACEDGRRAFAYELPGPRVVTVVERVSRFAGPRTVKLAHSPLVAGMGTDGRPVNITVSASERPLGVLRCDVAAGELELAEPIPPGGLVVTYSYRADAVEYAGFADGGRWRPLDLNPADGHRCGFAELPQQEVPTGCLLGRTIYLCASPAAVLSYLGRIEEELTPVRFERQEGRLALRVRLGAVPEPGQEIQVRRRADGTELAQGTGQAYWVADAARPNEILIVDPDIALDPWGRPVDGYYADYWARLAEPRVERLLVPRLYHSLSAPEEEEHILLATVRLEFPHTIQEAEVADARSRGGGVREELLAEACRLEPESRHYLDLGYWDGEPWQRSGVVLTYLPEEVKQRDWPAGFVEGRLARHRAAGVLPLVRYWKADEVYPARPRGLAAVVATVTGTELLGQPQHLALAAVMEAQ